MGKWGLVDDELIRNRLELENEEESQMDFGQLNGDIGVSFITEADFPTEIKLAVQKARNGNASLKNIRTKSQLNARQMLKAPTLAHYKQD